MTSRRKVAERMICAVGLCLIGSTAWAAGTSVAPQVVVPPSSIVRPEDKGRRAHTNTRVLQLPSGAAPPNTAGLRPRLPPFGGLNYETPASLACVYGLVPMASGCDPNVATRNSTGGSRAIAIVDAFDDPTALGDLQAYSAQFGLPAVDGSNFRVIFAAGTRPPFDAGWQGEEALDVEMAHALAPHAKVILVEAASSSLTDMLQAERVAARAVAAAGGGEVSNSWGADEFAGETTATFAAPFAKPKVVFFAATGDAPPPSYPAVLRTVVAVGGTSILRTASGGFAAETSWTEAGSGPSVLVPRPAFQNLVAGVVGTKRGVADIAADANPDTGVWVFVAGGWAVFGGTSVSSPIIAAVTNTAGHFLASSVAEEKRMYAHLGTGAFRDIRRGTCGPASSVFTAVVGYDFCTGVGSPKGLGGL